MLAAARSRWLARSLSLSRGPTPFALLCAVASLYAPFVKWCSPIRSVRANAQPVSLVRVTVCELALSLVRSLVRSLTHPISLLFGVACSA